MTIKVKNLIRDPVGPGTPAWTAFDRAIEAWQAYKHQDHLGSRSPIAKRFYNLRRNMVDHLKTAGCTEQEITDWTRTLDEQRNNPAEE